jgi:hypothetical protein
MSFTLFRNALGNIFNRKYNSIIDDDFIANTPAGLNGWISTVSGTGAAIAVSNTLSNSNHIGILNFSTGTTATGRSVLSLTNAMSNFLLGSGALICQTLINIPTLSNGTQRFNLRLGFGDNIASGDNVDGVYFEYDDSLSANWRICSSANSVRTKTNTSVAVALGWTTLGFILNAAGNSIDFYINGVSVGNITTNIPTSAGRNCEPILKIEKTIGATSSSFSVDYFNSEIIFNTPR